MELKMYPSYLNLSKKELNQRIEKFFKFLEKYKVCSRKCGVNRLKNEKRGFCRFGFLPMVSVYHSHFGEILSLAIEKGLKIHLVYNTSSYDSVEVLKLLDGIIDIYMPDAKYSNDKIALKYSLAPNYFEIMKAAIKEMYRHVGNLVLNESGITVKGLLVRHLVLPNNLAGIEKIVKFLASEISKNTFTNIMPQYFPYYRVSEFSELNQPITEKEYQEAINLAKKPALKKPYGK